jgi:peptide/nickel transport system permease protein
MLGFLLRRLAASLLLLLLVLTLLFLLLHLVPGDPTQLVEDARLNRAERDNLRRIYGLDRPLPEQYATWLGAVALSWDWGTSLSQQRPVTAAVREALPGTLLLTFSALAIEYGVGLLLGIAAYRRRGTAGDHLIRVGSLLLYSQPVFWSGLMAILLFSSVWPVLPGSHMHVIGAEDLGALDRLLDVARHLALPAATLGLALAGANARFVRASLLEVMGRDFIRTARAKGLSERRVLWIHGLRNALPPLIQLLALSLPALLSGALITEVVFAWPGLGRLTYSAILSRDYPLVLATTAMSAALVVLGNLLADFLLAAADPRVRAS